MNATEAKALLLPIPKAEFLNGRFSDNHGKCCAIGHLVRLKSDDPSNYEQRLADGMGWWKNENSCEVETFARETVREFNGKKHDQYEDLAAVNNRTEVNGYTQDNPKDRVMALLNDMIADGY
jgi:hypothetical protein|tara:strand:+ start:361 stop:726 length:366 start_codon:yes stop_codon:yes gene_type:complete